MQKSYKRDVIKSLYDNEVNKVNQGVTTGQQGVTTGQQGTQFKNMFPLSKNMFSLDTPEYQSRYYTEKPECGINYITTPKPDPLKNIKNKPRLLCNPTLVTPDSLVTPELTPASLVTPESVFTPTSLLTTLASKNKLNVDNRVDNRVISVTFRGETAKFTLINGHLPVTTIQNRFNIPYVSINSVIVSYESSGLSHLCFDEDNIIIN